MIIMMTQLNGASSIFSRLFSKKVFMVLLICPCWAFAGELKPFTTDACSSFPDGTLAQQSLWAECCIRHDLAYWQGGSYQDRLQADEALEQCVAKVGEPEIAKLMLAGVRVGGTPYLPTSFRWGYGWPWLRGYKSLTEVEKVQVKENLKKLELMLKSLNDEIKNQTNEPVVSRLMALYPISVR